MNAIFEIDLIVGGYSFRVTNDLKNWDDVKYSFKRDDFGGVVRSFSTKFEFAGKARQLLKSEYDKNYLFSSASVALYTTNNSRLLSEKFRCALDFSTMDDDGNTISINAIDDTLASLIKAKKGVQYDIPVADVKEEKTLHYDRLQMNNTAEWIITGDTLEEEGGEYIENTFTGNGIHSYPLYLRSSEIAVKNVAKIGDVENKNITDGPYDVGYFFENTSNEDLKIDISMNFMLWVSRLPNTTSTHLMLLDYYINGGRDIKQQQLEEGVNIVDLSIKEYILKSKRAFQLRLNIKGEGAIIYQMMPYASDETLKISFNAKDAPIDVDVIKPTILLNSILKSINGNKEGVIGEIAPNVDDRLGNCLLVPAESVRGITQSKIHTSYTKFCDWMSSVFGFVPVIGSNKVTFAHRNSLYSSKTGKQFGTNFNNFKLTVDPSLIYSSVKVGYEKKDYESVNGRDEFRFTNEFTTGITISDKTMTLISPYRADAYGIEFLAQKRGEDTTDNSSDNDVFFVCAELKNERYELVRNVPISGVISPSTMFNVMYSPKSMIKANEKFIGVFAGELVFASSEGNSDVWIDGVSEKANIQIPERLFRAEKISIESPDIQMPESMDEIITLEKDGKTHQCYLVGVDYNVGRPESAKYNLIAKSYEDS